MFSQKSEQNELFYVEIESQGFLIEIISHLLSFDFLNLATFIYVWELVSCGGKWNCRSLIYNLGV